MRATYILALLVMIPLLSSVCFSAELLDVGDYLEEERAPPPKDPKLRVVLVELMIAAYNEFGLRYRAGGMLRARACGEMEGLARSLMPKDSDLLAFVDNGVRSLGYELSSQDFRTLFFAVRESLYFYGVGYSEAMNHMIATVSESTTVVDVGDTTTVVDVGDTWCKVGVSLADEILQEDTKPKRDEEQQ